MSLAEEQEETTEFLKIKLMEKDREIADFESRVKKSEFKHNRQIKEVKIAEQRLQRTVKDQKSKTDKLNNQLRQIQEQHRILRVRYAQLKQEKEKEILDIYNKYGLLKEEVRSYERILPTFTFLLEIDKSMNEIPVYEDIYINLNERALEVSQLNEKHQSAKLQWQQIIKNMMMNEEMLKCKKLQAQKNMKEMLSKMYENQHHLYEIKCQNENLKNVIMQTNEQLELARQRSEILEQSLKEYQLKMESLAENFQNQLRSKEEEVTFMNNQEKQEIQERLQYNLLQYQKKENMYIEQIGSFEEEINFLNQKYREELFTFEEHFLGLKEQTDMMKKEMLDQKKRFDQLQERYNENMNNLARLSVTNEKNEQKIMHLKGVTQNYKKQMKEILSNKQSESNSKLKQLQVQYQMIEQRCLKLNESLSCIIEQKDHLEHENSLLRQEIDHKQKQLSKINSSLLDIPYSITQYNEFIRRKSISITQKPEQTDNNNKERSIQPDNAQYTIRLSHTEERTVKIQPNYVEYKDAQGNQRIKQLQQQIRGYRKQVQSLKQNNQLIKAQTSGLKQKNLSLIKQVNDAEGSSTKNLVSIYKLKLKTLQEELRQAKEDLNKYKEDNSKLRTKSKQQNEALKQEINNSKKQMKQLLKQMEVKERQGKRLLNEAKLKENSLQNELSGLRVNKELEGNRRKELQMLRSQIDRLQGKIKQLQESLKRIQEENHSQKQLIVKLQDQSKHKSRQVEKMTESLLRQRKERSLLTVPSLQSFQPEEINEELQINGNLMLKKLSQKQDLITKLQREVSDLKEQSGLQRQKGKSSMQQVQKENKYYVQTIIEMKMKCAQSEMRAHQKQYLYVQLKKKLKMI